jgi:hypothetical protein
VGTMARTAVLAVTATLLAGCSQQASRTQGTDAPAASAPTPVAPSPTAPADRRWAGIGGLVVAVPDDWGTVSGVCASPGHHEVAVQAGGAAAVRCALTEPGAPSLTLSPPGSLGWSPGRGVRCTGPRVCSAPVVGGASRFRVTLRGPGAQRELLALLDSASTAPDGWTTVPAVEYGADDDAAVEVLAEAGLVGVPPDVEWPHYVIGTEPAVGSLIAEGSEVALVPGDG